MSKGTSVDAGAGAEGTDAEGAGNAGDCAGAYTSQGMAWHSMVTSLVSKPTRSRPWFSPNTGQGIILPGMALPFPLRPCELELSTSYAQWDFLEQVSGALENF